MSLLQAIWENQFYYLFGFLFLVFIILVVSCSQISIVMVYFQLCAEVRGAQVVVSGSLLLEKQWSGCCCPAEVLCGSAPGAWLLPAPFALKEHWEAT